MFFCRKLNKQQQRINQQVIMQIKTHISTN
jgi:hypothetical protein